MAALFLVNPDNADDSSSFFARQLHFGAGGRGKGKLKKRNAHGFQSPTGPVVRDVQIGETDI